MIEIEDMNTERTGYPHLVIRTHHAQFPANGDAFHSSTVIQDGLTKFTACVASLKGWLSHESTKPACSLNLEQI